jgi:hypothetical protein
MKIFERKDVVKEFVNAYEFPKPHMHAECLGWLGASDELKRIYSLCDGEPQQDALLEHFYLLSVQGVCESATLFFGRLSGSFLPFIGTELKTYIGEFKDALSEQISIIEVDVESDLAIKWANSTQKLMNELCKSVVEIRRQGKFQVELSDIGKIHRVRKTLLNDNPERFDGILLGSEAIETRIFNAYAFGDRIWVPHEE